MKSKYAANLFMPVIFFLILRLLLPTKLIVSNL